MKTIKTAILALSAVVLSAAMMSAANAQVPHEMRQIQSVCNAKTKIKIGGDLFLEGIDELVQTGRQIEGVDFPPNMVSNAAEVKGMFAVLEALFSQLCG